MKRQVFFVIFIIATSLITDCTMFGSGNSTNSVGQSSFPLTPGSTWTYAIYNSVPVPPGRDTVQVSILKTDTTLGKIQSLWELKYTGNVGYVGTDSITVMFSGNTLHFDFPQGVVSGTQSIVFPLIVGKKWTVPIKISTQSTISRYSVVSKDTVSWQGGTFNRSYQVVQKASIKLENDGIHATTNDTTNYWIEPGIGIVKIHQYEHRGSVTSAADYFSNTTWTLLSYKTH